MHDLFPQKKPPTLSAITLGFVVATFLPPVILGWLAVSGVPDLQSREVWAMAIPLVASVVVGIVLGCWVSSDAPVGCAILLSPFIPAGFCFVLGLGIELWKQNVPFPRTLFMACAMFPIILLLCVPTAGVFILTRWLVKGRV